MKIDLSLVIYRPNAHLLAETLASFSKIQHDFRYLYILVSGGDEDSFLVAELVRGAGLVDRTLITHRYDNLGFAAGHNYLLERAFSEGGRAVLVVNPDIEISQGAVERLARAIGTDAEEASALFGPVIRQLGGKEQAIDSAGIIWTATGRHFDRLQGEPDFEADDSLRECAGVTGACLLVPRAAHEIIVNKCGFFFDHQFIAYREDAELGIRAQLAGVSSIVVNVNGFSHVRTVRGAVRGNGLADLLGVRNRFLMKWRMGHERPGVPILAVARDLLVAVGVCVRERSSLPGLLEAFRMRRFLKYTSPYRALRK